MKADKVYSLAEIREHSCEESAWVILDGLVYDVTEFLVSHPGGIEITYEHLGTDISEVFRGKGDIHQHSNAALDMLEPYKIGRTADGPKAVVPDAKKKKQHDAQIAFDFDKPLVYQAHKLGTNYNSYVHKPQHLKEPARFFQNPFLELCSRTPWYAIPLIWWPIASFEIYYTATKYNVELQTTVAVAVAGFFSWSLLEYLLHRFIFHMPANTIHSSPALITLHFLLHGCHHLLPMDSMRLVFPPIPAAILMIPINLTFCCIVGPQLCWIMLAGATFGYTCYDLTHYFLHHGVATSSYFRSLKTSHLAHHYKNPVLGFGISSKFWDIVFDTQMA